MLEGCDPTVRDEVGVDDAVGYEVVGRVVDVAVSVEEGGVRGRSCEHALCALLRMHANDEQHICVLAPIPHRLSWANGECMLSTLMRMLPIEPHPPLPCPLPDFPSTPALGTLYTEHCALTDHCPTTESRYPAGTQTAPSAGHAVVLLSQAETWSSLAKNQCHPPFPFPLSRFRPTGFLRPAGSRAIT